MITPIILSNMVVMLQQTNYERELNEEGGLSTVQGGGTWERGRVVEESRYDGIFWIGNIITYHLNNPFITTTSSGRASLK